MDMPGLISMWWYTFVRRSLAWGTSSGKLSWKDFLYLVSSAHRMCSPANCSMCILISAIRLQGPVVYTSKLKHSGFSSNSSDNLLCTFTSAALISWCATLMAKAIALHCCRGVNRVMCTLGVVGFRRSHPLSFVIAVHNSASTTILFFKRKSNPRMMPMCKLGQTSALTTHDFYIESGDWRCNLQYSVKT